MKVKRGKTYECFITEKYIQMIIQARVMQVKLLSVFSDVSKTSGKMASIKKNGGKDFFQGHQFKFQPYRIFRLSLTISISEGNIYWAENLFPIDFQFINVKYHLQLFLTVGYCIR